jgi:RNA polymerase sigma-70 factor, ECF subfamily
MDDDFERLAKAMRPRLHRYCAGMMGSSFDGEDVVQEALAHAAGAWASDLQQPERWLFRIAHNAAIDAIRARARRHSVPLEPDFLIADERADAGARVSVVGSFVAFLPLPVPQRACVVLIDVLGYSASETAEILGATVPAIKAALRRGRETLAERPSAAPVARPDETERLRLRAYADLFNARAFDALRELLAADVRLDLAARTRMKGRTQVETYFSRYAASPRRWRATPVLADGRPALLATALDDADARSVILLEWDGARIGAIRDFLYASTCWTEWRLRRFEAAAVRPTRRAAGYTLAATKPTIWAIKPKSAPFSAAVTTPGSVEATGACPLNVLTATTWLSRTDTSLTTSSTTTCF